jgi:hypothetical protein
LVCSIELRAPRLLPKCGSSLFWERNGHDMISITAGSLDAPTGLQMVLQIFAKDKGDYYELDHTTPIRTE